ncbi:MAG: hypothetical protein R2822_15535 [Spirosomataceae bacterium]
MDLSETQWISVGVHPWYLDETNWEKQLLKVQNGYVVAIVVAIECGLDRLITLPLKKQLLILKPEIILAEQLQKP